MYDDDTHFQNTYFYKQLNNSQLWDLQPFVYTKVFSAPKCLCKLEASVLVHNDSSPK